MMKPKRVAFLCTGDELVHGDILDTNGPYLAQQLLSYGIQPGRKVVVRDDATEIENAIRYLLEDHDALITVGGLGPTSDDQTRFAIANFLEQPLLLNGQAWNAIVERLSKKGIAVPDNNRQQALFPKNAAFIHNARGTAPAFYIHDKGKDIFALPGPPSECRPIFDETIIPRLIEAAYGHPVFRKKWLLLAVSEGLIAETLDPLVINTPCDVGYRLRHPYLEVKLSSENQAELDIMSTLFEKEIGDKSVSTNNEEASEQFLKWLSQTDLSVSINDTATRGKLAAALTTPSTHQNIRFHPSTADIQITITGLNAYWDNQTHEQQPMLPFTISIDTNDTVHVIEKEIRQHQQHTLDRAVELICWELLKQL